MPFLLFLSLFFSPASIMVLKANLVVNRSSTISTFMFGNAFEKRLTNGVMYFIVSDNSPVTCLGYPITSVSTPSTAIYFETKSKSSLVATVSSAPAIIFNGSETAIPQRLRP